MADPAVAVARALDGRPMNLVTLDAFGRRHQGDVLRLVLAAEPPGDRVLIDASTRQPHPPPGYGPR
jgi:hypothetical protein